MAKLTRKQQLFVDKYIIDLNATQAAIRAGYSSSKQVKLNASSKQIAQALYDGYGYGHVINRQDIPKYLKELNRYARRSMLSDTESIENKISYAQYN